MAREPKQKHWEKNRKIKLVLGEEGFEWSESTSGKNLESALKKKKQQNQKKSDKVIIINNQTSLEKKRKIELCLPVFVFIF